MVQSSGSPQIKRQLDIAALQEPPRRDSRDVPIGADDQHSSHEVAMIYAQHGRGAVTTAETGSCDAVTATRLPVFSSEETSVAICRNGMVTVRRNHRSQSAGTGGDDGPKYPVLK